MELNVSVAVNFPQGTGSFREWLLCVNAVLTCVMYVPLSVLG